MRNLKKLLAVLVVVAMIATSLMTAFAADTTTTAAPVSPATKACADIGMLNGTNGTVDAAYGATTVTRMQAARLFLRLKGLEADALATTATANFSDSAATNADGVKIMAYLKANPGLGFGGYTNGKFGPADLMNAQQYYKVVLTALGYAQKDAAGKGDFAYADTFTFAAGKGLTALTAANNTKFTIDNLATATVEGLKATTSDAKGTLAAALIAAGKLDAAKATAAGIIVAPAITVSSVASVTNTRLEVVFSADASAVKATDFTVASTATTPVAVAVTAATPRTDKTHVFVDTAAMTAGSSYTVNYAGKLVATIVSKPATTALPAPAFVLAVTPKIVRVAFASSANVDTDTLVAGNFSIKDAAGNVLAISSAALDTTYNADTTNNATGNVAVLLSTAAQTTGSLYTVTMNNIKNTAGNVMTANTTANFAGATADVTAPAISYATANGKGYVDVVFTETTQLDATSATNPANYTIAGLTVTAATIQSNVLGAVGATPFKVRLSIKEAMVGGTLYTLSVNNIADIMGNKITTAVTVNFAGVAKDTSLLTLTTAVATNNTTVSVTFNKTVGTGALSLANYTIAGLTISAAAYDTTVAGYDATTKMGNVITLTTSAQTAGTLYKVVAAGLVDDLGLALDTATNSSNFAGVGADTTAPTVASASATAANTVKVVFSEKVDTTTATNVLNYTIDNSLGYPSAAAIDSADATGKTVVLTVGDMTAGILYTVTVTGVKDTSANVISATNTYAFPGVATSALVKPSAVVSINNKQIKVIFNQAVDAASAIVPGNYLVQRNDAVMAANEVGNVAGVAVNTNVALTGADNFVLLADGKTVVITVPSTSTLSSTGIYKLTTTVTGKFGAGTDTAANTITAFAGTGTARPDITIVAATAVDTTHAVLTFSEKLSAAAFVAATDLTFVQDNATATVLNTSAVTLDANDATKVNVTLAAATNFTAGLVYRIHLTTAGANAIVALDTFYKAKTDVTSTITAQGYLTTVGVANPTKVNVSVASQTESNIITVTFDQNIAPLAANAISLANLGDVTVTTDTGAAIAGLAVIGVQTDAANPAKLKVYVNKDLTGAASGVYKVAFGATIGATITNATVPAATLAVSGATVSALFAKAIVDAVPSISSVVAIDSKTLKITLSESVNPAGVLGATDFVVKAPNGTALGTTSYKISTDATVQTNTAAGTYVNTLYVILQNAADLFAQGNQYIVELTAIGSGSAIADLSGNLLKGAAVVDKTVAGISTATATLPGDPTVVSAAAGVPLGTKTKLTITTPAIAATANIYYIVEISTDAGVTYTLFSTGAATAGVTTTLDNLVVGAAATHARVKLVNLTTGAVSATPGVVTPIVH